MAKRRINQLMKCFLFVAVLCLGLSQIRTARADDEGVNIEYTFPDEVFRDYVSANFDENNDGFLSPGEIEAVTSIYVNDWRLNSLQGIEVFPNLVELSCCACSVAWLDVSQNTLLEKLDCRESCVNGLTITNCNNLKWLNCTFSCMSSLDVREAAILNELVTQVDAEQIMNYDMSASYSKWSSGEATLVVDTFTHIVSSPETEYLTIEFDSNGGTSVSPAHTLPNHMIFAPTAPTKENVGFVGWFTDPACTIPFRFVDEGGTVVTENITLYAKWQAPIDIETTFPDETFRGIVGERYDTNGDGLLSVEEINAVTRIEVNNCNINSLQGIGVFSKLNSLYCGDNPLQSIDLCSNKALEYLYCEYTQLSSLDVSQNGILKHLGCYGNELTSLDLSNNTALTLLSCSGNERLQQINVSNCVELEQLFCDQCSLSEIYVKNNTQLRVLSCSNNFLVELDVSGNPKLTSLDCHFNQLTRLDFSENPDLTELECKWNQLQEIILSQNVKLRRLSCVENQLEALTVGDCASLTILECEGNNIPTIDIQNCPNLCAVAGRTDLYEREEYYGNSIVCICDSWRLANEEETKVVVVDASTKLIKDPPLDYVTLVFDSNGGSDVPAVTTLCGYAVTKQPEVPFKEGEEFQGWYYDIALENPFAFGDECGFEPGETTLYAKWGSPVDIETTFPDEVFRESFVRGFDTNNDGYLNADEIANVTYLDLRFINITTLQGIEVFTGLTELRCDSCGLTALDVSSNTSLTYLSCSNNQLTSLDLSRNTSINSLDCQGNQLTELELGDNTVLMQLFCGGNSQLGSLDLSSHPNLIDVYCQNDGLRQLIIGEQDSLNNLYCPNNQLTSLDLSNTSHLTQLTCYGNLLSSIDVSSVEIINDFVSQNSPEQCFFWGDEEEFSVEQWYCEGVCLYVNSSTSVITNPALTYITVSFNSNGGTAVPSVNTFPNHVIGKPIDTTKEGMDFCGWYADEDCTIPFHFRDGSDTAATVVTESITLYAKWFAPIDINTTFPDQAFADYLQASFDYDGDYHLSLAEVRSVSGIYVDNMGIFSLQGIEVFTQLCELHCESNQLTELDVRRNPLLMSLRCSYNQLSNLDLSENPMLVTLVCVGNQLTTLDFSRNAIIETIECGENQLTTLNIEQNTTILELRCERNRLTGLLLGENTGIRRLRCFGNAGISELDITGITVLNDLVAQCDDEQTVFNYGDESKILVDYWTKLENCIEYGLEVDSTARVISNPMMEYYTVTFDSNGGSDVAPITVLALHAIAEPEPPTNGSMEFAGWYGDPECTYAFDFAFSVADFQEAAMIPHDVTIYAKWSTPASIELLFPDEAFRRYVSMFLDENHDGLLNYREIQQAEGINVANWGVSSLQGIEALTELATVYCAHNTIEELDFSHNPKLMLLDCDDNNLKSLNLKNNYLLEQLYCRYNELTELDLSHNQYLVYLFCAGNQLTSLNVAGNNRLECIYCQNNKLTTLALGGNSNLNYLECQNNYLHAVDITEIPILNNLVTSGHADYSFSDPASVPWRLVDRWVNDQDHYLSADSMTEIIANPALNYVTVSFDSNGGSGVPSIKTLPNHTVAEPENPTCEGKEFLGWYSDASFTHAFSFGPFGTVVTGDITLYAKWRNPIVLAETFPDEIFRAYVAESFDTDNDGCLSVGEISDAYLINVESYGIASLEGIEVFSELTHLNCSGNLLTSLDVSSNRKLFEFYCGDNLLTELDVKENTELRYLGCGGNQLTTLDLSKNTKLWVLYCSQTQLTELDLSNNSLLEYITASESRLTSLDVSATTVLNTLDCRNNQLTSLNLGQNEYLKWLDCSENCLTSVDVTDIPAFSVLVNEQEPDWSVRYLDNQQENITLTWYNSEWNNWMVVDSFTQVIADPALPYYTITFESNGGSDVAPLKVLPGYMVTQPADPVKEGMDFCGWYKDTDYTAEFCFGMDGETITGNITLYAQWSSPVVIATAFPDEVFRNYVTECYDTDRDGILSRYEREAVREMYLCSMGITSLQGIEVFTKLSSLDCTGNALTQLDVSMNKNLISLNCRGCSLTTLSVGNNNKLEVLDCGYNQLSSIDVSANTALIRLQCDSNQLSEIHVENNSKLQTLTLGENQLTEIDVSNNPELTALGCEGNQLTELNVTVNTLLTYLSCSGNALEELDVSNSPDIIWLFCEGNHIASVDIRNCTELCTFVARTAVRRVQYDLTYLSALCDTWYDDAWETCVRVDYTTQLITTPALSYVAVSFDTNGGSEIPSISVLPGFGIYPPEEPTKEETFFTGWYADPELTTPFEFGMNYGNVVTEPITLYAQWYSEPLEIWAQPISEVEVTAGDTVEIYVAASGTEPLSYQWQAKSSNSTVWTNSTQTGATTNTLTVLTKVNHNGYQYRCIVSDGTGQQVISDCTTLTVLPRVEITPAVQTVRAGETAEFSVDVTGKGPLTYQWQAKGPNATRWTNSTQSGSKTATISIATTMYHNGYQYRCAVTDAYGHTVYTNEAELIVLEVLKITEQPVDQVVSVGDTAVFTVAATGPEPLTYQWQAKGPNSSTWTNSTQPGATTATLSVKTTASYNGYKYRCIVTDDTLEYETSFEATLTVNPKITTQPLSRAVTVGDTATFTVAATGKGTLKYQWQAKAPNSTTWSNSTQTGAKTATLSVKTNVNHNNYQYRCIVTDANGNTVFSDAATLTIIPKITIQPVGASAMAGDMVTFTVAATGKATLTYQWQAKGPKATSWSNSTQSGAKTATLSVKTNSNHNGYQYRCVITDGNGKQVISDAVTLTIATALTIMAQPSDKSVEVGDTAKFSVSVTGEAPFTYQWQAKAPGSSTWSNSTQSGAKTATLSVKTITNHNGYQYRCIITDANGNKVTSAAANLTILPKITAQPASQSVSVGTVVTLSVGATGKATLTYQWQYRTPGSSTWKTSTQTGAKTANLKIKTTVNHNGYEYRCVITDGNGKQSYSEAATLTVQ